MAKDPYAELAAKYGLGELPVEKPQDFTAYDEMAAKYGVAAPTAPPPPVDAGPAARRAKAGLSPGPREVTDEEVGAASGPMSTKTTDLPAGVKYASTEQDPGAAALPSTDTVTVTQRHPGTGNGVLNAFGPPASIKVGPETGEMADPAVQMGTAAAMGHVAGAPLAAIPRVGAAASAAVEGGTANKAMGGDFTTGAVLTGAVPALRAGRAAAGSATNALGEGAVARVKARQLRNLTEDATSRSAREINKVAGPEGQALDDVISRNEDLRHALAVHAKDRPAAALRAVTETKTAANAARNADFEAMQNYWANKPTSSQASIPAMIDDYKALMKTDLGDGPRQVVLRKAMGDLTDFGDRLRDAQGLPPAAHGDYSGTVVSPKDLRKFEQTIGEQAFAGMDPKGVAAVKARVHAELYKPIARQVNALAEATPGVDAKRFATTGQDIHVLMPVEEELKDKVRRLADGRKTFIETAKDNAHKIAGTLGFVGGAAAHSPALAIAGAAAPLAAKAAARVGRGIDYRLAEAQLRRVQAAQAQRAGIAAPAPASRPAIAPAAAGIAAAQPQRQPSLADLYLQPSP